MLRLHQFSFVNAFVDFLFAPAVPVGQEMATYDVAFEVRTSSMTNDPNTETDVVVETLDGGFLSHTLVSGGEVADVGALLAVLVEEEEDLDAVNAVLLASRGNPAAAFADAEVFKWQVFLPVSANYK